MNFFLSGLNYFFNEFIFINRYSYPFLENNFRLIVSKYRRLLILYFFPIINDLSLLPIHFRFLYKSTIGKVVNNFFISIFFKYYSS